VFFSEPGRQSQEGEKNLGICATFFEIFRKKKFEKASLTSYEEKKIWEKKVFFYPKT
jgi:hypothetical protein